MKLEDDEADDEAEVEEIEVEVIDDEDDGIDPATSVKSSVPP